MPKRTKPPQKKHKTQKQKNWTKTREKTQKKTNLRNLKQATCGGHPGILRDISGTPAGHLRDISGTSPGHLRDVSGTTPGHLRDISGTTPGHLRHKVKNLWNSTPKRHCIWIFAQIWARRQNFGIFFLVLVFLRFSVGVFAPPNRRPNIRPVRPSYSPFPHEFFFGFYPAWNEKHNLRFSN